MSVSRCFSTCQICSSNYSLYRWSWYLTTSDNTYSFDKFLEQSLQSHNVFMQWKCSLHIHQWIGRSFDNTRFCFALNCRQTYQRVCCLWKLHFAGWRWDVCWTFLLCWSQDWGHFLQSISPHKGPAAFHKHTAEKQNTGWSYSLYPGYALFILSWSLTL